MRVAIVDDSRLARVELRQQLQQIDNIQIIGEASNLAEGVKLVEENLVDLILLDIDLPDGSGFDLLESLGSVPNVIFVTAFNEFAIKSFEYNALDYLLKPVRLPRLKTALSKVQVESDNSPLSAEQRIFIKDKEDCYFVPIKDIFAFEAMGNYTRVHLRENIPSIYKPIGAIAERLDKQLFFRASRSWIINTSYIAEIEPALNGTLEVTLENCRRVDISKRQAVEFKRRWSL